MSVFVHTVQFKKNKMCVHANTLVEITPSSYKYFTI